MANEIYRSNDVQLRQQIKAHLDEADAAIAAAVSDDAYDESTWNGVTTIAPSKNAVRDELEAIKADYVPDTGATTIDGVKTFSSDPIIPDEAYGSGWGGALEPPTKNAVWDRLRQVHSECLGATLNDDAVYTYTFATGISNGWAIYVDNVGGREGLFAIRTLSAPYCRSIASTGINVTTGALTGTTGTDGFITISTHTDGKLYIENRTGVARFINLTVCTTQGVI